MAPDLDRRVAITGIGVIGSFGIGIRALWDSLSAGRTNFAPCTRYPGTLPCAEAVKPDLRRMLHSGQTSRMSLVSQFAIAAVHLALGQARLPIGKGTAAQSVAIVYGTSHGPGATTQEIYDDLINHGSAAVKPRAFQESVFNAPASLASIQFGVKGPILVLAASVCAPAVLQQAQMLLAHPGVDAVIALCADELCEAVQRALRVLRWHRPATATGASSPSGSRRGAGLVGGRSGADPRARRGSRGPRGLHAGRNGGRRLDQRCLEAGPAGAGRPRADRRCARLSHRCRGDSGRRGHDPVDVCQHRHRRPAAGCGAPINLRRQCDQARLVKGEWSMR